MKRIASLMLVLAMLFATPFAHAESVNEMSVEELEAYIAYLQVVLRQKREAEGHEEMTLLDDTAGRSVSEADQTKVFFNEKEYVGVYTGDQVNGVPHGNGRFEGYSQGNRLVYEGSWENGQMKGSGKAEAEAYTIHFDTSEGIYDRTGPFAGDVFDGIPEGNGTYTTQNTQGIKWHYEGEWKGGQFNGQGKQWWDREEAIANVGAFNKGEFSPTAAEAFSYVASAMEFAFRDNARNAIANMKSYFCGKQQKKTTPAPGLVTSFDINQYKKRPDNHGNKLIYVQNANVFQVLTWEAGCKKIENIMMEAKDGTIYHGFYYGESDIIEGMTVSTYVLPLDWSTYESVDSRDIWAVFCAVTDFLVESYETLQRGDSGDAVLQMKFRMQELGYFSATAAFSDSYNSTCVERVKQFQQVNGLSVTGIADHDTLSLLYSDRAKKKP